MLIWMKGLRCEKLLMRRQVFLIEPLLTGNSSQKPQIFVLVLLFVIVKVMSYYLVMALKHGALCL